MCLCYIFKILLFNALDTQFSVCHVEFEMLYLSSSKIQIIGSEKQSGLVIVLSPIGGQKIPLTEL